MTTQQADEQLKQLGLFQVKSMEEHAEIVTNMIGESAMLELGDHFNGEHENSEEYLLEKCGEDPYFSIIHSMKYNIFKEELIWLDKVLPENALVFDLGCNAGHMTALCAKMRNSCRFVGYEMISSTLKKANRIKSDMGLDNLSFENYDVMNLKTDPKPDGLMILQALGAYLDDPENIVKLCNFVDTKAFIILIEKFVKEKELKVILKNFEKLGFNLIRFDKISCDAYTKVKTMPAIFLERGFDTEPKLDIERIRL
jgi:SAM-dependent methyltransferase